MGGVKIEPEQQAIKDLPPVGFESPHPYAKGKEEQGKKEEKESDDAEFKADGEETVADESALEDGDADSSCDESGGIPADPDARNIGEDEVPTKNKGDEDGEMNAEEDSEDTDGEEETPVAPDYAKMLEEERAERRRLQEQMAEYGRQPRAASEEDIAWNDPRMLEAFGAIQRGDNEALSKYDPSLLTRAKSKLSKAEEVQREFAFDPDGFIDKRFLPVVDHLVRMRFDQLTKEREFARQHGEYLKANERRMADLAKQTGITDPNALLALCRKDDQIRELSSQKNKAEVQANHAKKIQADVRQRMKPPSTSGRINMAPKNVSAVYTDPFTGKIRQRSAISIAREQQGLI
jgi:hypothetical protein